MKEKAMAWIEKEYLDLWKPIHRNAEKATDRCFGIIMFVTNELLGYDSPEGKELIEWWENWMCPKFHVEMALEKTEREEM